MLIMLQETLTMRHAGWALGMLLGLTAIIGCGSDDSDVTTADVDTGAVAGPLYLIAASFLTGDQTETYLVTSTSFDETTIVDPTDGPKLLGGIVPVVRNGSVFVPDSNGP